MPRDIFSIPPFLLAWCVFVQSVHPSLRACVRACAKIKKLSSSKENVENSSSRRMFWRPLYAIITRCHLVPASIRGCLRLRVPIHRPGFVCAGRVKLARHVAPAFCIGFRECVTTSFVTGFGR